MKILRYAGILVLGASVLSGCSSSSSDKDDTSIPTPTALAAQSATLSIADPAGTAPVVTVTTITDSLIGLTATVTTPGSGGAGTIDIVLSATNNAPRDITNFKAVVDTAASTMGTATVTASTDVVSNNPAATNNGERFVYLGEPLVTPPGKTVEATDDFRITLGATPADPLVIQLNLPTEDVALITTDDSDGEEEIIAIDTGVGSRRTVGITSAYVFQDVDQSSSGAANATEGFMSADGRYAYLGHKTNPYVMILDTHMGTVDAVALLDPPEVPYASGQSSRIGSVDSIVPSPDGKHFYASVLDGSHPYDNTSNSSCAENDANGVLVKNLIIKVNVDDMEVVGELDVSAPGSQSCGDLGVLKRISLSDDGKMGAAALKSRGRVILFDPEKMELVKSLIVNGPANDRADSRYVAVNSDGSKVYVAYDGTDNNELDVINTDDFSVSQLEITADLGGSSDAADLRFGPDGRLYYMRRDNVEPLVIFDLSTTPVTEVVIDSTFLGGGIYPRGRMAFSPYGDFYYFGNSADMFKMNIADDTISADSPIDPDTNGYHLTLPTRY